MQETFVHRTRLSLILIVLIISVLPVASEAVVDGTTGTTVGGITTFNLFARDGKISMGEGQQAYSWGYAEDSGPAQYPGPTLIIDQGATVAVNLTNQLPTIAGNRPVNVSIFFPGQTVTASGGIPGLVTQEAPPGATVSYTFTASEPGTYTYYSGTDPELQVEMGLLGAIVVRPAPGVACPALAVDPVRPSRGYAYCNMDAYFDREYLFVLSEIDPVIHRLVEFGRMDEIDNTARHQTAWFENGRTFPDTMVESYTASLPYQPYSAMPVMHPGEKVLIRLVGGGRNMHPFHTHGANHLIVGRDGRMLKTAASAIIDLPVSDYTTTGVAGETVDEIWGPWTGEKLGWDVYGHIGTETGICVPGLLPPAGSGTIDANGFDVNTFEYCPDHGKPIPVSIPAQSLMQFGPMYGGTPYLGVPGDLPPPYVKLNTQGGLSYMWHSHNERELTTNNVFIGGMATMALVLPYFDMDGNPIAIP